jgi:RNA polymerase sigma-70 factor (ECF subfamily)
MNRLEAFNQHRPLLFSIAYRMLGSVVDAEDMVQETFVRWQQVAEVTVRTPKAYLSSIITRLCIGSFTSVDLNLLHTPIGNPIFLYPP